MFTTFEKVEPVFGVKQLIDCQTCQHVNWLIDFVIFPALNCWEIQSVIKISCSLNKNDHIWLQTVTKPDRHCNWGVNFTGGLACEKHTVETSYFGSWAAPQPVLCSGCTHALVLLGLFLSQAAPVSLGQMLEVKSVSLSCSFLSQSCAVSSAGLCLLCWLSSGCRDALVPLERLQALLMPEETRLRDVRRSLSSIWCLGTNTPGFAAWNSTFIVLLFVSSSQVFFFGSCSGARGGEWRGAAVTPERQVKHFYDWPEIVLAQSLS